MNQIKVLVNEWESEFLKLKPKTCEEFRKLAGLMPEHLANMKDEKVSLATFKKARDAFEKFRGVDRLLFEGFVESCKTLMAKSGKKINVFDKFFIWFFYPESKNTILNSYDGDIDETCLVELPEGYTIGELVLNYPEIISFRVVMILSSYIKQEAE